MAIYTYDDFERAANAAGLLEQFSQYDLDLARAHPEAGLSLLSLKQDYAKAATDEARALANEAANQVRSSYGSYTGGSDGSKYYAMTPQTHTSAIDAKVSDTLDRIGSYGSFSYGSQNAYQKALEDVIYAQPFVFNYGNQAAYDQALADVRSITPFTYDKIAPTYVNPYQTQQKEMLDKVLSRDAFEWSKETDPVYGSYKKAYLREGERATANALAQAAGRTGGQASTAAIAAATQAGDYYATKLSDAIPTLYQQAFDRYLQEYQMKLSDLSALNQQQQLDYARYLNELGQYNTDRNFAMNAYNTDVNRRQAALTAMMQDRGQNWTEQKGTYDAETAAQLNALGALQTDRSQAYKEYLDNYNMLQTYLGNLQGQSDTIYTRALNAAQLRQQQEQQALENQIALAQLGYGVGDSAYLEALGITPNNEALLAASLAAAGRAAPIGTGGTGGGSTGTGGAGGGYTGGGTGGSGGAGNGGGTEVDAAFKQTVLATYPDGVVTNPDDWQTLLAHYDEDTLKAAGITYAPAEQAAAEAGETPQEHKDNHDVYHQIKRETSGSDGTGEPEINLGSVDALGYGPISAERLAELVEQGLVEEYIYNGQRYFRRVSNPATAGNNLYSVSTRFGR